MFAGPGGLNAGQILRISEKLRHLEASFREPTNESNTVRASFFDCDPEDLEAADPMSTRAWLAFAGVSIIWGIPYLFIKIAVDEGLSPAVVAWSRVTIAAIILVPLAWRTGALRGLRRRWRALVAFAVAEMAVPFPLIAAGEQRVSSSLAAILIATVPIIVAVLAIRFDPAERARGPRLAGLLIGLAGVVVLLGVDIVGRFDEMVGAALILVAAVAYAAGPMIVKRSLAEVSPLGPVAAAFAIGTFILTVPALLTAPASIPSPSGLIAVVVLGVVCSALALMLFFTLIAEAGPGRATVVTYVNPAVAVVLGVTILGEHAHVGAIAGLLLILVGSWFSTGGGMPSGRALRAWIPWRRSRSKIASEQLDVAPCP